MKRILASLVLPVAMVAGALSLSANSDAKRPPVKKAKAEVGLHKIKHVIVIMQENRSFDHYFGTYPGADGFPRNADGGFAVCVPNPATGGCEKPFHDTRDLNAGGPHGQANAVADVADGRMDGFVASAENARVRGCRQDPNNPICSQRSENPDVMGYHDGQDIPNYWAYAKSFVLQDHMFEPVGSWSPLSHLYMVSGWAARCSTWGDAQSCRNEVANPQVILPVQGQQNKTVPTPNYAWTDLTYLLNSHK